jgi:hypothetical protein
VNKEIKRMTNQELYDLFSSLSGYCLYDHVKNKRARRPDVHALLVLDKLAFVTMTDSLPMVDAVFNSTIYFRLPIEVFKLVATHEIVQELVYCGVTYDLAKNRLAFITSGSLHAA